MKLLRTIILLPAYVSFLAFTLAVALVGLAGSLVVGEG